VQNRTSAKGHHGRVRVSWVGVSAESITMQFLFSDSCRRGQKAAPHPVGRAKVMSHHIELRIIRKGGYPVVHVEGDINRKILHDVSAAILWLLEKGYEKGVIVDLKGAEYIDSMGASILVGAFEVAQKRSMDFILTGLN
jgi:anti-anti-sigma factor